jgi:hypothetical protein
VQLSSKRLAVVTLALLALGATAKPGSAQFGCPQIEPYLSVATINGTPTSGSLGLPDQVRLNAGQCITLRMVITKQSGATITMQDVTTDPNTRFFTNPVHGTFSGTNGSTYCVSTADCNLEYPIYGVYHDPCSGTNQLDTVHVHVNPCGPTVLLPTISCVGLSQSVCVKPGICGAIVTYGLPLVGGGVPPLTTTCVPPSGSFFPMGTTMVVCTVRDALGNTAMCSFPVTVYSSAQTEISMSVAAVNGIPWLGSPDQVNIHVGDKITLRTQITVAGCPGLFDVTPVSTFFTSPPAPTFGTFVGNVFTATASGFNKQFPIYGDFANPCTGTFLRDTVHVTVK